MASTVRVFDYDEDASGAHVIVARDPLSPGCMTDREVDEVIGNLKADLDRVGREMKRAIEKRKSQPLFGSTDA
jgi:hypothetical protein